MNNYYLFFLMILLFLNSISAKQYYDKSDCRSNQTYPGSKYTCNIDNNDNNTNHNSCKTFLVYRANPLFGTLPKIAALFNVTTDDLNRANGNDELGFEPLRNGTEILVPIHCSCSGEFFESILTYTVHEKIHSLSNLACGVFEGLVKAVAVFEENLGVRRRNVKAGSTIRVPLKCACPDNSAAEKGIKYLVTYPFLEGDDTILVSEKFGISPEDLWEFNNLTSKSTVFPITTVLVPIRSELEINRSVDSFSPPQAAEFLPVGLENRAKHTKLRNIVIAVTVLGVSLVLLVLILFFLCLKGLRKLEGKRKKYHYFKAEQSSPVCLSPDLLSGIKFSLAIYTTEAIERATEGFSDQNEINSCPRVYKGALGKAKVMVKETRVEEARQAIEFYSRINHTSMVKLVGICYGDEVSWSSYLVFEYPENGCLRDLLSEFSSPPSWSQRVQIAFGVASGLHYLHCCIFPSYLHGNVRTRNIFVTSDFRARLGEIGPNKSLSEKDDIYSFGLVVLELISGREEEEGHGSMRERVGFLDYKASNEVGVFEKLRSFVDRRLRDDYSLAEALCLAVLAKACLEDDSLNRPSMDDIIKVLSRMV